MHIYGFLAAILGVQQTLWGCRLQRRQDDVTDFYLTLCKFAVLLRKCRPYHKATVSN